MRKKEKIFIEGIQHPFDSFCLNPEEYTTKIEILIKWDHLLPDFAPCLLLGKSNLGLGIQTPEDGEATLSVNSTTPKTTDDYLIRQVKKDRTVFGAWPLCGSHACMDLRPFFIIKGGIYFNGDYTFLHYDTISASERLINDHYVVLRKYFALVATPIYI